MSKSMVQFKISEAQRRNQEKSKLLDKYSTSEALFDALIDEINTLRSDESDSDLSVGDQYNFGVDYDVDLILELIRDLRSFTRYIKYDDDKSINTYDLNYLRPYF